MLIEQVGVMLNIKQAVNVYIAASNIEINLCISMHWIASTTYSVSHLCMHLCSCIPFIILMLKRMRQLLILHVSSFQLEHMSEHCHAAAELCDTDRILT